jgi:multidrug resistance efflux pump
VREGDTVSEGDTILKLREIKDTYLDPNLLNRTGTQVTSKQDANKAYRSKILAIENQVSALENSRSLKLNQTRNKIKQVQNYIQADSVALLAAENELEIADKQFKRQQELYDKGLKSLTELEQRNQQFQNVLSKKVTIENKLIALRNELLNAVIELSAVEMDYNEKLSKARSDEFSAISSLSSGEADVAKLQNQFSNYAIRSGFYYVIAPQSGQITRTIKAGIGEVVKEYEHMLTITPTNYHFAVEMYVQPMDLPLVSVGQKVSFLFDGWPSIFFSGWPNVSYGTFFGKVAVIENSISTNGKFRVLVAEDKNLEVWPSALKLGGGARGYALLKDVPIWYEIWRNLNGFPPDFYNFSEEAESKSAKKK